MRNPKQYLKITPQGSFEHELKVEAKYDPNGADNPAWIQNVINADNQKRDADLMRSSPEQQRR